MKINLLLNQINIHHGNALWIVKYSQNSKYQKNNKKKYFLTLIFAFFIVFLIYFEFDMFFYGDNLFYIDNFINHVYNFENIYLICKDFLYQK